MYRRIIICLAVCIGFTALDSFASEPNDYLIGGRELLFDGTLAGVRSAYQMFDDGLNDSGCAECQTNRELRFFHALSETAMLLVRDDGDSVNSIFELMQKFGITISGQYWAPYFMPSTIDFNEVRNQHNVYQIPDDAPDINDIRDLLDASFIPQIEEIINNLNSISDTPEDRFRIYLSTDELGIFYPSDYEFEEPLEPVEVDYGEVLMLKGFLTALKTQLEFRAAYDTYISPSDKLLEKVYGGSFKINEDILLTHPEILKVLPTLNDSNDGKAALAQIRQDWIDSINYYIDTVEYIRLEEDWQGDDFLYIDPDNDYAVDSINDRLIILRDSLVNDTVATFPLETTKTYDVYDVNSRCIGQLTLVYDITGINGEGGSMIFTDGNLAPSPWDVDWFGMVDTNWIEIDLEYYSQDQWGQANFNGNLSKDSNTITNATFEYWGSSNGTINNLSGQVVDVEVEDANIDLNPIFGSSGRYPNPVNLRDLLPVFDQWNAALPGTVGHGLGDDPTLGGILPQMTQYGWQKEFGLQPSGLVYLDYISSSKITINGNISDWDANQLVFNDISGDTENDSDEVNGVDIKNLYMAYDWDNLYGAIEFYDDINSTGHYYYTLFLNYSPYESSDLHSLTISVTVSSGYVDGHLYYMDTDDYGWIYCQYITDFTAASGQKAVEFKIPFDDIPDYLPGRFITIESGGWDPGWSESDGEKDSTHLQIGEVGTISGTVACSGFAGDLIFVQAYTDPQDPEGSAVATVMIAEPGPYILEGIGLGWQGYVRAFAPLFGFDNPFELGAFQIQTSTPVFIMYDDLDDIDITLNYPIELEKGVWREGEIDSETREVDWYYFDAVAGKTYSINLTRGTAQYACIALYDRDAESELVELDYGQTQLISWTCPVSGRYYVEVANGYYLPAGGTYQIRTGGGVIYVDTNASGLNNGTSWPNAYKYLQDALSAALTDDEIWVAQGTYRPDENTSNPSGTNDRNATFGLKNYVAIYGGFASGGGTWDSRDLNTYKTILSGDLADNDAVVSDPCDLLTEPTRAENSYHIVTGTGTDADTILDGFTIAAGNANEGTKPNNRGGGMYNEDGSLTVTNCIFSDNATSNVGGGVYNNYGSPTLINCTFTGNSAPWGGGMRNNPGSSPTLINCTFSGNLAALYNGGGMHNNSSTPTVINCTFTGNLASELGGGGMWNSKSNTTVVNCIFIGNYSKSRGGGGMYNYNSSPTVANCTFSENSALLNGGGISDCNSSSSTIVNCIFWNNTAPAGAQIYNDVNSFPSVSYCDVQNGWAGGAGNIDADPCFIGGGNYRLLAGSPCIDAGDNDSVSPDTADLDGDGNTTEPIPIDLDDFGRFADDPGTVDTGNGIPPIVDMGTYEFGSKLLCRYAIIGDLDDDCRVEFSDLRIMAENWLGSGPTADIEPPSGDSRVNFKDFAALAEHWLIDCWFAPDNPACAPK